MPGDLQILLQTIDQQRLEKRLQQYFQTMQSNFNFSNAAQANNGFRFFLQINPSVNWQTYVGIARLDKNCNQQYRFVVQQSVFDGKGNDLLIQVYCQSKNFSWEETALSYLTYLTLWAARADPPQSRLTREINKI